VEELLAEGGMVDHVTIYRWVQRSRRSSSRQPELGDTSWGIAGMSTRPT
jgi:hypothetical protein